MNERAGYEKTLFFTLGEHRVRQIDYVADIEQGGQLSGIFVIPRFRFIEVSEGGVLPADDKVQRLLGGRNAHLKK